MFIQHLGTDESNPPILLLQGSDISTDRLNWAVDKARAESCERTGSPVPVDGAKGRALGFPWGPEVQPPEEDR